MTDETYDSSDSSSSSVDTIDSFDLNQDADALKNKIVLDQTETSQKEQKFKTLLYYYITLNERILNIRISEDIANIIYTYYHYHQFIFFKQVAKQGQLFLKYLDKRRRKPQDKIIRVRFNSNNEPFEINWGGCNRLIKWNNISYIAYGLYTLAFKHRNGLDAKTCFSVIGKNRILNIQALNEKTAIIWVTGLRLMLGQTDIVSEQLLQNDLKNGRFCNQQKNKIPKEKKTDLMKLQRELFEMTLKTVFRNLEDERIWNIDKSVRDKFDVDILYQKCIVEDVQWKQWNYWIREQVTTYIQENIQNNVEYSV
eukprot:254297_1